MKYIFSLILIFYACLAFAQTDTARLEFRTIRVGTDALSLIRSAVTPGLNEFEIGGDFDLRKYLVSLDIGRSSRSIDSLPGYNYEMSGSYFRMGVDANFLKNDEHGSIVFFGLRYGRSLFNEQLDYTYSDNILGDYINQSASNDGATARWFEANVGMKARVWKNFWLGYRASYKFGLRTTYSNLSPFLIPGFGPAETSTEQNSYWGFNYYVLINLFQGK